MTLFSEFIFKQKNKIIFESEFFIIFYHTVHKKLACDCESVYLVFISTSLKRVRHERVPWPSSVNGRDVITSIHDYSLYAKARFTCGCAKRCQKHKQVQPHGAARTQCETLSRTIECLSRIL